MLHWFSAADSQEHPLDHINIIVSSFMLVFAESAESVGGDILVVFPAKGVIQSNKGK